MFRRMLPVCNENYVVNEMTETAALAADGETVDTVDTADTVRRKERGKDNYLTET